MLSERKTAVAVGVLFIIGTVSGILSVVFTGGVLENPDFLARLSSVEARMKIAVLFVLAMGFSLAFIPILLYPVIEKYSRLLATGYMVFRGALETVTYIITGISLLLMTTLGVKYAQVGSGDPAPFDLAGALLKSAYGYATLNTVFVFGIGALLLYTVLYRSRLLPRWLSVWGVVAIIVHLATGILLLFGLQTVMSLSNSLMNFPIFLQEMVMAVWLIVKGFSAVEAGGENNSA